MHPDEVCRYLVAYGDGEDRGTSREGVHCRGHGAPSGVEHTPADLSSGVCLHAPIVVLETDQQPEARVLGEVENLGRWDRVSTNCVEAHSGDRLKVPPHLPTRGEERTVRAGPESAVRYTSYPPRASCHGEMPAVHGDPGR